MAINLLRIFGMQFKNMVGKTFHTKYFFLECLLKTLATKKSNLLSFFERLNASLDITKGLEDNRVRYILMKLGQKFRRQEKDILRKIRLPEKRRRNGNAENIGVPSNEKNI